MYLGSDIRLAFHLGWIYYLILALVIVGIIWKFSIKNYATSIAKILSVMSILVLSFYSANGIHLYLNTLNQQQTITASYKVKLKGVDWGKIGLQQINEEDYDEIKVKETAIKQMRDGDMIEVAFKVGILGLKYDALPKVN